MKKEQKPLPNWKDVYLRINHPYETAEEMASYLSISVKRVIDHCTQKGYRLMPSQSTITRPPAQYSNPQWQKLYEL